MTLLRVVLWAALLPAPALAADQVDITLPSAITFSVTNVSVSTTGTPNPSTITYTAYHGGAGESLKISFRSDAASFTPPAGTAIPCGNVSWTTSNAVNGTGYSGTLTTAYQLVYWGTPGYAFGSVDITWALAAPGTSIRAGNHTLVGRWKLESLKP